MKIAFLSFNYGEYCIRLARALATDHDVHLFLPRSIAEPYAYLLEGSTVQATWFRKPRLRAVIAQIRLIRSLARQILACKPDVLHIQQGHVWLNLLLPLVHIRPLVITVHDPKAHVGDVAVDRLFEPLTHHVFRQADELIVHAEHNRQLVASLLHVPETRIHVIPHVALGDDRSDTDIQTDARTVLFFGRIWAYKGLDYLIRAEPFISARRPDVRIVIAGYGEDFERYRRQMIHPERFVIENRYIPNSETAGFFRRAAVVVLPYIDASQSGVVPMAFTFGKPVVVTTVGGLPESVQDGRTGLLVPPRDPQALADAIVTLLDNPDLRRTMGENAREIARTIWSPEAIAIQTAQVYQHAVEKAGMKTHGSYTGAGERTPITEFTAQSGAGKAGRHDGTG